MNKLSNDEQHEMFDSRWKEEVKLNLGSGLDIREGYINVDLTKKNGADVVHDLERFPYPFKTDSVDYVLMDNSLEHLEDTIAVMKELHRICKDKAIIDIYVPHCSGVMAFSHLTHKRFFGSGSFDNFECNSWEKYSDIEFKTIEKRLIWLDCRNWWFIRPFKFIIDKIINYNKFMSERFLCYLLGGFDHIYFKLEVEKEK